MNFEEWGAEEEQRGLTTVEEMYADWRIEREKLIGALENVLQDVECETSKHYPVENCAEKGVKNPCKVCRARAVLAKVRGKK